MPGRRFRNGGFRPVEYGDVPGHAPMELDPDDPLQDSTRDGDIDSLPENTSLVTVDGEEFSTAEEYMQRVHLPYAVLAFAAGAGSGALAGTAATVAGARAALDLSKEQARVRRRELADRALAALSPKLREKIAASAYLVIEALANENHEEAEERLADVLVGLTRQEGASFLDVVSEAVPGLPYDVQRELIDLLPEEPEERKEAPPAKPARKKPSSEWAGIFDAPAPSGDMYQAASAAGMVTENQFNGLGSVEIPARTEKGPGVAKLQDCVNRNLWMKSLVLDAGEGADRVLVASVTVAGLPINVGNQGTPLSMFATNSTRFGTSFGRRLSLTGQSVVISLENHSDKPVFVSGGIICDEINPYAMQKYMEQMLLSAAVAGFSEVGGGAEDPLAADDYDYDRPLRRWR
jgi:hypothetical protein